LTVHYSTVHMTPPISQPSQPARAASGISCAATTWRCPGASARTGSPKQYTQRCQHLRSRSTGYSAVGCNAGTRVHSTSCTRRSPSARRTPCQRQPSTRTGRWRSQTEPAGSPAAGRPARRRAGSSSGQAQEQEATLARCGQRGAHCPASTASKQRTAKPLRHCLLPPSARPPSRITKYTYATGTPIDKKLICHRVQPAVSTLTLPALHGTAQVLPLQRRRTTGIAPSHLLRARPTSANACNIRLSTEIETRHAVFAAGHVQ
jgi:hypothetical protein